MPYCRGERPVMIAINDSGRKADTLQNQRGYEANNQ